MGSKSTGYDRILSIFSTEGRLYQTEYAFKAIENAAITAVSVKCPDAVVVVCQKKRGEIFLDSSTTSSFFKINNKLMICNVGFQPDCKFISFYAARRATDYKHENGYDVSCDWLCRKVADYNHASTVYAARRITAVSTIFIGIDDEFGPLLYKTDPSGYVSGYNAVAIGTKGHDANIYLEKRLKKRLPTSIDASIELALLCLGNVLGVDFKANEIEIAQITFQNMKIEVLSEDEIDAHLTRLADRD